MKQNVNNEKIPAALLGLRGIFSSLEAYDRVVTYSPNQNRPKSQNTSPKKMLDKSVVTQKNFL